MDDAQKQKVLAGLTEISRMFHSMSPSSWEIRNHPDAYPDDLSAVFRKLAKGEALEDTSVLNQGMMNHPELGSSYAAALFISDKLVEIDAKGIKESGPRNFQHMVSNPASYNPPPARLHRSRHSFPNYD